MPHLYPGNPAVYPANVRLVDDGDPGDAATLNAPWGELADRTAYDHARVEAIASSWFVVNTGPASCPTGECLWTALTTSFELPDTGGFSLGIVNFEAGDVIDLAASGIVQIDRSGADTPGNPFITIRLANDALTPIGPQPTWGGNILDFGSPSTMVLPFSFAYRYYAQNSGTFAPNFYASKGTNSGSTPDFSVRLTDLSGWYSVSRQSLA